jgi:multidrug efflux pump subunit AcrB
MWVAFAVALVRDPARIEAAWRRLRALPVLVQALAWLLFLPVLAGIAIWRTGWPQLMRVVLVGGLAGWNVLMFLPRPA